jgi:c-di-GMP-binding flagellar brake protein YcgR
MIARECCAEIFLPDLHISLMGGITALSSERLTVQLLTTTTNPAVLRPGTSVVVTIEAKSCLFRVEAKLVGEQCGLLEAEFSQPAKRIQRRQWPRVPCSAHMAYRAVRPDGSFGAWCGAVTEDVGMGGLSMRVRGHAALPHHLEVLLELPAGGGAFTNPEGRQVVDLSSAGSVKAAGKIVRVTAEADGSSRAGVRFTVLPPVTRLRIARLTEDNTEAAVRQLYAA